MRGLLLGSVLLAAVGCKALRLPIGDRLGSRDLTTQTLDQPITFTVLPKGTFKRGSNDLSAWKTIPEPARRRALAAERPKRTVRIRNGFAIARTEVTVGQFRQFVRETKHVTTAEKAGGANGWDAEKQHVRKIDGLSWKNPGFGQSERHPVVCVSREDASAFCQWLSRKDAKRYRLPTEDEWEYAAVRLVAKDADDPAKFAESLRGQTNLADASLSKELGVPPTVEWDDGFAFTAPVSEGGQGNRVSHMFGNVAEWCSDRFDGGERSWFVVRGGSWFNGPFSCRPQSRHDGIPTAVSTTNGFRIVLELE